MPLTNEKIANMTPREIVEASKTLASEEFGELVMQVDNTRMGAIVRRRRKLKKVRAKNIGDIMGLSKSQVHFLEIGRKRWSLEILQDYLAAVEKLDEAASKH